MDVAVSVGLTVPDPVSSGVAPVEREAEGLVVGVSVMEEEVVTEGVWDPVTDDVIVRVGVRLIVPVIVRVGVCVRLVVRLGVIV